MGVIAVYGDKNWGTEQFTQKLIFFMSPEKNLITYESLDTFILSSASYANATLDEAIHDFHDVSTDVTGFVTTPDLVVQYISGMTLEEL